MEGLGFRVWLLGYFLFCSLSLAVKGQSVLEGTVRVEGGEGGAIGKIDDDFICATLDWWPPEKCDYGTCAWGHASLLNLDLSNQILINAVKEVSPLKIRLGGSLQDKVTYASEDIQKGCSFSFTKNTSAMFGFTEGCLPMNRWDQLNEFFQKTKTKVIFGLNALKGRTIQPDGYAAGAWNYSNAESFIRYTVDKNYTISGWELGNELCGGGVGTRVSATQYASDTTSLRKIVTDIYKDIEPKPIVLAPGGFFDHTWFQEFLHKAPSAADAITHHIYSLGAGVDPHLMERILDPTYLDGQANTFRDLRGVINGSDTKAVAWVGESGGAYNSGRNTVTNAFVFSFWYLDQLGMSAAYNTRTYCRQSLVGGNYGLLDTTTFVPNPDYYSALLWHRLMGRNALKTNFTGTNKVRAYAHCAKPSNGVVVMLINLDGNSTVQVNLAFNGIQTLTSRLHHHYHHHHHHHHNHHHHRKSKGIHLPTSNIDDTVTTREEYHLTAKDGDLHSRTVLLNGQALTVNSLGEIPTLEPVRVNSKDLVTVDPYSIAFVHMPNVHLAACS